MQPDVGRRSLATMGVAAQEERLSAANVAVGAAAFAALVVLTPVALMAATPQAIHPEWILTLIIIVAAGARLSVIIGAAQRRLFDFTFWLFTYAFFGLAPLVQLRSGIFPDTTPDVDTEQLVRAVVVILVSLAAYQIGSFVAGSADARSNMVSGVRVSRVAGLGIAALLAGAYYVARLGFSIFFASRQQFQIATGALWPDSTVAIIVQAVVTMLLLVAFVALTEVRRSPAAPRHAMIYLGVILILVTTVNPISSARYVFGTFALAAVAALGGYATGARFRVAAALIVATLLLVFPVADYFRYAGQGSFKSSSPVQSLTTGDFDAFAQITNMLVYLDRHGSTHGRQGLGVVLFWVPRALWPAKPEDTGILLADERRYSFTNLSAPLPAELMINGAWPGLVVGMFAFGWAARRADARILRSLDIRGVPSVLGCILPAYLFILLRGSLLQAMPFLFVIVLAALWVRAPRGGSAALETRPGRSKRMIDTGGR
jgi:hypothetical protein